MNTHGIEPLELRCDDGRRLRAAWHGAADARAVAVVAPALGVPAAYYADYCVDLAARGIAALCFDYRGIAGSADPQADRGASFRDWGRQDLQAALQTAAARHPDLPLLHIGHSCGGQLLALAPAAERLAASAFVAVSSPHWRHWHGAERLKMLMLWYALIPLLGAGRTYFPARRIGFSSVDVPAGVIGQWAAWARYRDYLFDPALGLDARPDRLACPLAHWRFADDEYGSEAACDAIIAPFARAAVTRRDVPRPDSGRIGHLGFFRAARGGDLWPELASWLLAQTA